MRYPLPASTRPPRARRRPALALEPLESRWLCAADLPVLVDRPTVNLTPQEQLLVEQINLSRAAPEQTALRLGIDLNAGVSADRTISSAPKAPLAVRQSLIDAAGLYSQILLDRDLFSHEIQDGASLSTPTSRAAAAGYTAPVGENIAVRSTAADATVDLLQTHDQLFESPGHRLNLLREDYRDLGVGVRQGDFQYRSGSILESLMTTELFGITSGTSITGVVYDDAVNDNDRYDLGEGIEGAVIQAIAADGTIYRVHSGMSGGYTLDVPTGTYTVTASGPGLAGVVTIPGVQIVDRNVKIDVTGDVFTPQTPGGGSSNTSATLPANLADYDVSEDGQITPADALLVLNYLNEGRQDFERRRDVTGDGLIAPNDVLLLINFLNEHGNGIVVPSLATLAYEPANGSSDLSLRATPADGVDFWFTQLERRGTGAPIRSLELPLLAEPDDGIDLWFT